MVNLDYSDEEYEQKNPAKKEEIPVPDIQETDESFKLDLPEIDYSAISTKNSDKVDEDEEEEDESGELVMIFSGSGDDLKLEVVDDKANEELAEPENDGADNKSEISSEDGSNAETEENAEEAVESTVEDVEYPDISEGVESVAESDTEVEAEENTSDEPIEAKIEAAELDLMPEQPEVTDTDEADTIEVVDEPVVEEWAKEEVRDPVIPSMLVLVEHVNLH